MNQRRVGELMAGHDVTLEVSDELLQDAIGNHGFYVLQMWMKSANVISILLQYQPQ